MHSDGRDDVTIPAASIVESSMPSMTDGIGALPVGSGFENLPAPIWKVSAFGCTNCLMCFVCVLGVPSYRGRRYFSVTLLRAGLELGNQH